MQTQRQQDVTAFRKLSESLLPKPAMLDRITQNIGKLTAISFFLAIVFALAVGCYALFITVFG